jgi:hypothetical protein
LIASVPGFDKAAQDLRRIRIRYAPRLTDRALVTLWGTILLGPSAFVGTRDEIRVGVAGTLVHEHTHVRQPCLLKTWSFWAGVATRTHPMHRYEWPAYARQAQFLQVLAAAQPELRFLTERELMAALDSFAAHYGPPVDIP